MEKNINQIIFYFVEAGPGHGSEGIKKECNVTCFDFFFFSVFLIDVVVGKKGVWVCHISGQSWYWRVSVAAASGNGAVEWAHLC